MTHLAPLKTQNLFKKFKNIMKSKRKRKYSRNKKYTNCFMNKQLEFFQELIYAEVNLYFFCYLGHFVCFLIYCFKTTHIILSIIASDAKKVNIYGRYCIDARHS